MKTKRSFLPLRIAAATVLTLLFVFSLATNATDASVDISSKNVNTIQSDIQAAINNVENGGGGTVTVTGSKTGADATLNLSIPDGVTVLWQAAYSENGSLKSNLIQLSGVGTFEVGTGGSLSTSTDGVSAICATADNPTVTVSGTGKVQAKGTSCAIRTPGNVLVSGGEVSAKGNYNAIWAEGENSTVTVGGGLVFAYGSGIIGDDNVIQLNSNNAFGFTGASDTGVVIAWNQGAGNTYAYGAETGITLSPASGATAMWATREGQSGIAYENGDNKGFIPLNVTVTPTALTGTVTITGDAIYGEVLTADTDKLTSDPTVNKGALSYQWKRGGDVISGKEESTYTLISADIGQTITVTVTAENCVESVTSDATAAVAKATPYIDPTPTATNIYKGNLLSASMLSNGAASVEGTFAWTDGTQEPDASGSFDVTFTPNDITNYGNAATQASVTVLDRDALEAKLAEAKAIKRGNYITSTWDALQEAITGAKTTLETEAQDVTQEAIDAALDALISAIDGLRHIYIPPPENNNNKNDDADEPTETPERPAATPEENPFDDVGQNDWFYDDVMFAYSRGLMTGTSARKFSPDAPMARGMIVTVLHRMESEPSARGATTFSDVADGKYYTGAVAWAEAEGIVDGYGNGLFGPEDDITRQDLALLFLRYARYKGLTLPAIRQYTAFIDDADVSDYAREAARTLYRAGIISGKPGSRLDPKGTATRAEVAAMLRRFIEAVEK